MEEGPFCARVNKLCSKCRVYCVILEHEQQPRLFHGKPEKHCTKTWLMIEQSVLSFLGNPGVFPRGNWESFKKGRAPGANQLKLYTELHELLREHCNAHAPCYIALQNVADREKNEVIKAGLWERLPLAQAIEMAIAFVPSADDKTKHHQEDRPASIKCVDNGQVIAIFATKRLRKLLTQQWPRHFMEGKSIFKFRLEDYPGSTPDTVAKRIRRWEELIKEGKDIKIISF